MNPDETKNGSSTADRAHHSLLHMAWSPCQPSGRKTIAQHFSAGSASVANQVPSGTKETVRRLASSLKGLSGSPAAHPALKCWAIFGRPCGTAPTRTDRCKKLRCAPADKHGSTRIGTVNLKSCVHPESAFPARVRTAIRKRFAQPRKILATPGLGLRCPGKKRLEPRQTRTARQEKVLRSGGCHRPGDVAECRPTTIWLFVFAPFMSFVVHRNRRFQVRSCVREIVHRPRVEGRKQVWSVRERCDMEPGNGS